MYKVLVSSQVSLQILFWKERHLKHLSTNGFLESPDLNLWQHEAVDFVPMVE